MTLLACIPIELQGSPTLAEVIAASLTTANLTGELTADQELIIKDADGNEIFILTESNREAEFTGRVGVKQPGVPYSWLDTDPYFATYRFRVVGQSEPSGGMGIYTQNQEPEGYTEIAVANDGDSIEDPTSVLTMGVGGTAAAAPYTATGYFYTSPDALGLLFQSTNPTGFVRFDVGGYDNPVAELDEGEAGATSLLLLDVDTGTLRRVSIGAADSGGTGYRVLRIPN